MQNHAELWGFLERILQICGETQSAGRYPRGSVEKEMKSN